MPTEVALLFVLAGTVTYFILLIGTGIVFAPRGRPTEKLIKEGKLEENSSS